ncbi:MAG: hypothetical protein GX937_04085 [Lentisphaerae bacterium]|jgi:hypothetical protein|nr:hypothetical protein [Lentisphaerota bacterium]
MNATKNLLPIGLLFLATLTACRSLPQKRAEISSLVNDGENVRVSKGKVTVAQAVGAPLLADDFAKPSESWVLPHRIFEDFTWIHHAPTHDIPSLRIERNPQRVPPKDRLFDTAWELMSKPLELPPNAARLVLELNVISNNPKMASAAGHGNSYKNALIWYDAKGDKLPGESSFSFNVAEPVPAMTMLEFDVPREAKSVVLSLGADTPDLKPGEVVAFTKAKLSVIRQNSPYSSTASFVTRPCRIGGAVSWEADIPAGTSVQVQASVAPEVDGLPGAWSDFTALGASRNPADLAPDAKWMRLKVLMTATEQAAPTLHSIDAGAVILNHWQMGSDNAPPHATRLSASPTENKMTPFVFSVTDENPICWNKLSISVNDIDALATISRSGDTVTIPPPKGGWREGVNIVSITLSDILGNEMSEKQVFYIGKSRTTNLVTMRDDGMTLVDGKPFFPIGMACAVKCEHNDNNYDKLFQMFADAGMNFARHFSGFTLRQKDAVEYITAAEKHGIKLYIAAGRGANDCDIQRLAENVVYQMHLPNLAWDTGDDTANHITPEQMRQRYNAIKAIDPHRITTQADPLGPYAKTRYRPYALYSDNFSPEIYPVHNDSKEDMDRVVPTVISTMKAIRRDVEAVKAPTRSCWPLIQYFYNCGRWRRLQTKEELRSMGYQAIIHGAQGVIWYRYAGYGENLKTGFTAEQWQVVVEVSRELRSLYDVLCQRAAAVQPPQPEVLSGAAFDCLDNPSVSLLLKEGDKESRILFAASSVREPVTARITVPGAKSIVDFFDGHVCQPNADGVFEDAFKPLGVHVYIVK